MLSSSVLTPLYRIHIQNKKNAREGGKEKRKSTRATLEVKKEIISEHENGVRASDLESKNGIPKSTISTS